MRLISDGLSIRYKVEKLVAQQYGVSKSSFIIYMVLRVIVLAIAILSLVNGRYENVWHCVLTLVLFCLPPFFERNFKADLPTVFEVIILFFIFAGNILGEIFAFYIIIPFWDTALHTIYGFIFAALGFSLIDILNKEQDFKFKLSIPFCCINSLGFTLGIGVLWEFFEFAMDFFFDKDMQKDTILNSFNTVVLDETNSNIPIAVDNIRKVVIDGKAFPFEGYLDIGLYDTMKDLAVAALGAVIFCFFLIPYLKTKGKSKIASIFIPVRRNWVEEPAEVEVDLAKHIINLDTEFEQYRLENEAKENAKSEEKAESEKKPKPKKTKSEKKKDKEVD